MGIIAARVEGKEAYYSFDIAGEPVCLPLMMRQVSCRFGHYWSISGALDADKERSRQKKRQRSLSRKRAKRSPTRWNF